MIVSERIGAPRKDMAEQADPVSYFIQVASVVRAELEKLRHDPIELVTRSFQPVLWLLLFGEVMARFHGAYNEKINYLDFLAAGILAQSVLFVAIFYGLSAIWERDLGVLTRYLVSPAPRSALVIGKAASSVVRGLIQAIIIYLLTYLLGVDLNLSVPHMIGVVIFVALGSILFSTLSLVLACIVKNREHFMGVGQLITMPIFFASNAIYPLSVMPVPIRVLSMANPLTYQVDALRALMIRGGASQYGMATDLAVHVAIITGLVVIAARLYPRMAY
jgi:ABC-2 type transport system permease protein